MKNLLAKLSTSSRSCKTSGPDLPTVTNLNSHDDNDLFRPTTSNVAEWSAEFASEPAEWESAFLNCWSKLKAIIICNTKSNKLSNRDSFSEVKSLLRSMCKYLVMEVTSQPEPIIGPILEHCFNEDVFWHLHAWATRALLVMVPRCQVMLLEAYQYLIDGTQTNSHYLLIHKPVLIPLLRLLAWCQWTSKERRVPSSEVDKYFIRLLNQICKKISEDSNLLELFFTSRMSLEWEVVQEGSIMNNHENMSPMIYVVENEAPFLVFRLLITYMHAADDVGQLAKDALLQIMCVSRRFDYVAKHIAESEFCAVLATGLSGFWSQLPKCICTALQIVNVDEFHKLNIQTDLDGSVTELVEFQKALLFCNTVVQDAHHEVVEQIIHYFYDGFLCKVVKAAVEQLDDAELVSIIVYVHLCLDTISEEALIQALLKMLIVADTSSCDMNLLEVVLSRMNDNERLCRVVLSFLRSLLELRCEDLMWNCLLRFIIPFIPLKVTRRFDVNISLNAAEHFLGCIPQCTHKISELNSNETFQAYLNEASVTIMEANNYCKNWAYKYDGLKPSLMNMNTPEELLSTRQPFIRLSSARSSFASNGINRYFQNRPAHGTQDSLFINECLVNGSAGLTELPPLNKLGEDDAKDLINMRCYDKFDLLLDSALDEFNDFNSQYELMTTSDNSIQHDYFHFTYEGISSESDEMNNSRRNSTSDEGGLSVATIRNGLANNGAILDDSLQSKITPYARAIQSVDWSSAASNINEFYNTLTMLLNNSQATRLPGKHCVNDSLAVSRTNGCVGGAKSNKPTTAFSAEENLALIEARFQYLRELNAERAEIENNYNSNPLRTEFSGIGDSTIQQSTSSGFISGTIGGMGTSASTSVSLPRQTSGLLLTCTDKKGSGLFLESLFSALEKLVDRNFTTNLQLLGVLNILLSYPQPVITSYLLYVDAFKSNALLRITNILENLKSRIDAYASATDGFEEMIRRGVHHKNIRAERFEKSVWMTPSSASYNRCSNDGSALPPLTPFGGAYSYQIRRVAFGNGSSLRTAPQMTPTRIFRHRTIESQENNAEASRTRNFAYAAILLSQLCQTCAAYALQHTTPPLFNQSAGSASFSVSSTPGR